MTAGWFSRTLFITHSNLEDIEELPNEGNVVSMTVCSQAASCFPCDGDLQGSCFYFGVPEIDRLIQDPPKCCFCWSDASSQSLGRCWQMAVAHDKFGRPLDSSGKAERVAGRHFFALYSGRNIHPLKHTPVLELGVRLPCQIT